MQSNIILKEWGGFQLEVSTQTFAEFHKARSYYDHGEVNVTPVLHFFYQYCCFFGAFLFVFCPKVISFGDWVSDLLPVSN